MYSNCYDYYFRKNAEQRFGEDMPWQWFKAIGLAESELNPMAISSAGAIGVMQLMPHTVIWLAEKYQLEAHPFCPHINIELGVCYARHCWDIWRDEEGLERIRFMLGSYNAGHGNIIETQKLAGKQGYPTDQWASIVRWLPMITGIHAGETIHYVEKVENVFAKLQKAEGA